MYYELFSYHIHNAHQKSLKRVNKNFLKIVINLLQKIKGIAYILEIFGLKVLILEICETDIHLFNIQESFNDCVLYF